MSAPSARRVRLVNPNSSAAATAMMLAAARGAAPAWLSLEAHTTAGSPPLIVDDDGAAIAETAVAEDFERRAYDPGDGVILSAFMDPGIVRLRAAAAVPVVGIGEAAMREAAAIGPFAVVLTTPRLAGYVRRYAQSLCLPSRLVSVPVTVEDPQTLMADPARTLEALDGLVRRAARDDRVDAVVIGGGPLADAARALAPTAPVALVEPVPAAVRRIASMLSGAGGP